MKAMLSKKLVVPAVALVGALIAMAFLPSRARPESAVAEDALLEPAAA